MISRTGYSNAARGEAIRTELMDLALENVKVSGWTPKSVVDASKQLGLSPMAYKIGGGNEAGLIKYFFEKSLKETVKIVKGADDFPTGLKDRVLYISKVRLGQTIPYSHTWEQATQILAMPQNVSVGLNALKTLSNEIWYLAGDSSHNMDWYVKRTLLATLYASTELYMITDKSQDHASTYKFLEGGIDPLFNCNTTYQNVVEFSSNFGRNAFNILASKGIFKN
ncbi:hypothetical protein BB559_005254 [Furculomyces boomerangus]|uniref:Ubiquinone biosynthesis protein n=2 Tax=Harpellales TaxID=61421 RepID=A0A2T9Y9N5_9FUNG|nr:hypothetical protein BB559_005254 [Furculomyces boomerangus]PVZ98883.1 hypothetical protein BB558_005098 [Smittium angustum]